MEMTTERRFAIMVVAGHPVLHASVEPEWHERRAEPEWHEATLEDVEQFSRAQIGLKMDKFQADMAARNLRYRSRLVLCFAVPMFLYEAAQRLVHVAQHFGWHL